MKLLDWFFKTKNEEHTLLSDQNRNDSFVLKIGSLTIGHLSVRDKTWYFVYTDEFKAQNKYRKLVGFSDLDKTYESEVLWPFFKLRIPGLKQPLVKEILAKENIDTKDEISLLRRFGRENVSNPYILDPI